MQEKYYRTVKASERMPESEDIQFRMIADKKVIDVYSYWSDTHLELNDADALGQPVGTLVPKTDVEWLEPIPIPDAAVLRSALEKILAIKNGNIGTYLQKLIEIETIAREALSAGDGSPEYEQSDSCREAEREDWEADREKKIEDVFHWLLGYTDFPQRQEGEGQYYWRTHLREKLKAIGIEIENSPSPPIQ